LDLTDPTKQQKQIKNTKKNNNTLSGRPEGSLVDQNLLLQVPGTILAPSGRPEGLLVNQTLLTGAREVPGTFWLTRGTSGRPDPATAGARQCPGTFWSTRRPSGRPDQCQDHS